MDGKTFLAHSTLCLQTWGGKLILALMIIEGNKQKARFPAFALVTSRDQLTCRLKPPISYLLCVEGISLLSESHHFSA
jgi:hypothetical protein